MHSVPLYWHCAIDSSRAACVFPHGIHIKWVGRSQCPHRVQPYTLPVSTVVITNLLNPPSYAKLPSRYELRRIAFTTTSLLNSQNESIRMHTNLRLPSRCTRTCVCRPDAHELAFGPRWLLSPKQPPVSTKQPPACRKQPAIASSQQNARTGQQKPERDQQRPCFYIRLRRTQNFLAHPHHDGPMVLLIGQASSAQHRLALTRLNAACRRQESAAAGHPTPRTHGTAQSDRST